MRFKTKTQLEKEIEEITYHKDHKTCNECRFCVNCWEGNSTKATLTQTNTIIELIEELVPYHYQREIDGEMESLYVFTTDDIKKLLTKIKGKKNE